MAMGPVQVLIIGFGEDAEFKGEALDQLRLLREQDIVRVIDLLVVVHNEDGTVEKVEIADHEELAELDRRMDNLSVVRVLSKPGEGWTGESGYVNEDVLRRHLPEKLLTRFQYFICGPGPLMDAMETALPKIGVPHDRVHTERFDMV